MRGSFKCFDVSKFFGRAESLVLSWDPRPGRLVFLVGGWLMWLTVGYSLRNGQTVRWCGMILGRELLSPKSEICNAPRFCVLFVSFAEQLCFYLLRMFCMIKLATFLRFWA